METNPRGKVSATGNVVSPTIKQRLGRRRGVSGDARSLAHVARGEDKATVVEETGIPRSTLDRLYENRLDLYLSGEGEDYDDRVDAANISIQRSRSNDTAVPSVNSPKTVTILYDRTGLDV